MTEPVTRQATSNGSTLRYATTTNTVHVARDDLFAKGDRIAWCRARVGAKAVGDLSHARFCKKCVAPARMEWIRAVVGLFTWSPSKEHRCACGASLENEQVLEQCDACWERDNPDLDEDLDECIDCGGSTAPGTPDPHDCGAGEIRGIAGEVRTRSIEAWFVGEEVHVDRGGSVSVYVSAQDASDAIRAEDSRSARAGKSTVTVISWYNTPAGFNPPGAE